MQLHWDQIAPRACLEGQKSHLQSGHFIDRGSVHHVGASIANGLLNTAAAIAAVPLKPNTESVGAFSSDFGEHGLTHCLILPTSLPLLALQKRKTMGAQHLPKIFDVHALHRAPNTESVRACT